jgi:hypothetical protein
MLCKKSKFDLLSRSHQRACHDFWLHKSRGFSLSKETYKFIQDNPSTRQKGGRGKRWVETFQKV